MTPRLFCLPLLRCSASPPHLRRRLTAPLPRARQALRNTDQQTGFCRSMWTGGRAGPLFLPAPDEEGISGRFIYMASLKTGLGSAPIGLDRAAELGVAAARLPPAREARWSQRVENPRSGPPARVAGRKSVCAHILRQFHDLDRRRGRQERRTERLLSRRFEASSTRDEVGIAAAR